MGDLLVRPEVLQSAGLLGGKPMMASLMSLIPLPKLRFQP
ncbi:hypothetical protein ymoll0001_1820 [Yersinia mollaretii ATCC 43969]|uniref:Uncharacterized protein n=1 Tax=Yersinia mollaretii (strain ATCC 43969 / DSM 18520 / CIP 103324 / CNY 7263 / WAIP 204) TaxID=349967 RepID=A0ABM9YAN1_YERMW|nr:hypothetical protein ymoll0001_1820 [Yersinia mollaretii ATCC 43969]